MPHILENSHLQFNLDPQQACWSLISHQYNFPSVQRVRMQASYRRGQKRLSALKRRIEAQVSQPEIVPSPHGPLRQLSLSIGPDESGLNFSLTFALPENLPIFLWKLQIENNGLQPVLVDCLDLLQAEGPDSFLNLQYQPAFFSNGWQSWSYAGTYQPVERFRRTRLGPLRAPTDVNAGTPQPGDPGHFSSNMFGVLCDRARRVGLLAGFLSQQEQFGSLEAWLLPSGPELILSAHGDGARLDPGCSMTTDWAVLQPLELDDPDPLGVYVDAVARQHDLTPDPSPEGAGRKIPTGWCSWYQFSSDAYIGTITPQDIQENLHAISALHDNLPLQIVQIDDGFEAQVGDWLAFKPTFSAGLAPLAEEISQAGLTPGLWLAPFIVHPKSRLAAEHPDWLLRGRFGRNANASFFWDGVTTALDLTYPDALSYVREVIHTAVHEWGFSYLKLDFLYAAALPGRYRDPTRTRAQVLRTGLQAVRQAAGEDAFLLGCGCPLGPAIGLVDGMRIGADTTRRWNPNLNGIEFFFKQETTLPSARNASHNALTRSFLHRRWWINDPDCLLVRPGTRLTLAEVQTVATAIALSGGALLLSDHLPDLPPERLRIAQALLPLIGQRPRLMDLFDSPTPGHLRLDLEGLVGAWHLLALFNWHDRPRDMTLRLKDFDLDLGAEYMGREFWSGRVQHVTDGGLAIPPIPAHGVALFALRLFTAGQPQYLGSDLHISQGLEVAAWNPRPDGLLMELERPGHSCGMVDLYLPQPPTEVRLEGQPAAWQALEVEGCYRVEVGFEQHARLEITYRAS
jgi:alpha-galactosidase